MTDTQNKPSGRRASRLPIVVDVVKNRINALGFSHQAVVMKAEVADIYISVSSIRTAISQGKASPQTIKALAVALKLTTVEFVVDNDQYRDVLAAIDALLPTQTRERIHSQGRILRPHDPTHCVQDKKNIIRDPVISRALIKGTGVPSLFEAVYASATFTPLDDEHKDIPFVPGMDYNHFLMLGAVLIVNTSKEKAAIGYHRVISHLKGTYKHTQGLSILWATGFEFNLKETMDLDMWNWMRLASDSPEKAHDAYTGKQDPALLRLLAHKLTLNPAVCDISPLCVITNDQRCTHQNSGGKPRVYTQYVFTIEVTPQSTPKGKPRTIDQLMGEYVQSPDQPAAVAFTPDMYNQFINHNVHTNKMDVAAWSQLHPHGGIKLADGISVGKMRVY